MKLNFSTLIGCSFIACSADSGDLSLYFSNDSMNGFKYSDAYETHDMGLKFSNQDFWLDLNLAIVSPDMYVYRNEYRAANRSYGELITATWGPTYGENFFKLQAIGEFGLDQAQDFAHRVLALQPIKDINDLVRMDDKVNFGIGYSSLKSFGSSSSIGLLAYGGTDRAFFKTALGNTHFQNENFDVSSILSLEFIAYDNIVSAAPIKAKHRMLVPRAELIFSYNISDDVSISLTESISLPTIQADNSIFAEFSAGITYKF